jgi:hypothetical protein
VPQGVDDLEVHIHGHLHITPSQSRMLEADVSHILNRNGAPYTEKRNQVSVSIQRGGSHWKISHTTHLFRDVVVDQAVWAGVAR